MLVNRISEVNERGTVQEMGKPGHLLYKGAEGRWNSNMKRRQH